MADDKRHTYSIRVDWTGNQGTGTSAYSVSFKAEHKPTFEITPA